MSKKYIYILLLTGFLFVSSSNFCSAFSINITSLPNLPANPELPDYIEVVFTYIIQIGGAIAVLALIIGAIRWLTSAGSPEKIGEARKSIYAAILGLVILFSSYIIIYIINPRILVIEEYPLSPLEITGDLYLKGGDQMRPCPRAVLDTNMLSEGLNSIVTGPSCKYAYLISLYDKTNLQGNRTAVELPCGSGAVSIVGKNSFHVWELTPGVYLLDSPSCNLANSNMMIDFTDTALDLALYKEKTKCVQIINKPDENIHYGAILHNTTTLGEGVTSGDPTRVYGTMWINRRIYGGYCGPEPIIMTPGPTNARESFPVSGDYSALTVFRINYGGTAGDGVTFYSAPWYKGGEIKISNPDIDESVKSAGFYQKEADSIEFDYKGSVSEAEKDICAITSDEPNFRDCPGSIAFHGDYLVVISGSRDDFPDDNCEVFPRNEAQNIELEPIFNQSKKIENVYIIPVKP